MLYGPFEVFAHERAFREDAGQQEREEDGEPAVDRKAGIEMDRVRRSRNGLADRADDEAEKLQREQRDGQAFKPTGWQPVLPRKRNGSGYGLHRF
jgi:hypothetical protein